MHHGITASNWRHLRHVKSCWKSLDAWVPGSSMLFTDFTAKDAENPSENPGRTPGSKNVSRGEEKTQSFSISIWTRRVWIRPMVFARLLHLASLQVLFRCVSRWTGFHGFKTQRRSRSKHGHRCTCCSKDGDMWRATISDIHVTLTCLMYVHLKKKLLPKTSGKRPFVTSGRCLHLQTLQSKLPLSSLSLFCVND